MKIEKRNYLALFQFFGGFILIFSIVLRAAIYDQNGWGYLELKIWGWMYRRGIWDYSIYRGFIQDPLVMVPSIIYTIGLVSSGLLMIISGSYYIRKLIRKELPPRELKLIWISIGITLILLSLTWMFCIEFYFSSNYYIYLEAGVSFLRNLKPSGPVICSYIIGFINLIIAKIKVNWPNNDNYTPKQDMNQDNYCEDKNNS